MELKSATDWLTWAAIVLPLFVLAWSAYQYVAIQRREEGRERFNRLFRIMDMIGGQETSLASKIAAVYELRRYPDYRELIVRFCRDAAPRVIGENGFMLKREMELTADFFEAK
jgi:hypothetical protein